LSLALLLLEWILMNGLHLCFEGSSVLSESAQKSALAMDLSAPMPVAMLGCANVVFPA